MKNLPSDYSKIVVLNLGAARKVVLVDQGKVMCEGFACSELSFRIEALKQVFSMEDYEHEGLHYLQLF